MRICALSSPLVCTNYYLTDHLLSGKFAHEHPRFFNRVIMPLLETMLRALGLPKDVALILFDIFVFVFETQNPFPAKL